MSKPKQYKSNFIHILIFFPLLFLCRQQFLMIRFKRKRLLIMSTDRLLLIILLFITLLFGQKLHVTTAQVTYDGSGNNSTGTKPIDAAIETGMLLYSIIMALAYRDDHQ